MRYRFNLRKRDVADTVLAYRKVQREKPTMKKPKVRTTPVRAKKPINAAKRGAKTKPTATAARKTPAARRSAGMDSLAGAIEALAAIAMELRRIADDLQNLMRQGQEPEVDALVITEVESSEAP
ncbi:MAG: hypothetical protein ACXWNN_06585, partial [Candidatus Binataceae bacterium]